MFEPLVGSHEDGGPSILWDALIDEGGELTEEAIEAMEAESAEAESDAEE